MAESKPPEQRTIDVDVEAIDTRGRTLHGYAAVYDVESADLGGFREKIAPGAFAGVMDADVRALLNHDASQVLGRSKAGTLRLADEQRGLKFEIDLPESPLGENVREAVRRGDIDGASFRFVVGEEDWDGELRTIKSVAELHDVTVATFGAYPAASVELRTRPEKTTNEGNTMQVEDRQEGGLAVEDRAAKVEDEPLERRVGDALRSVRKGEVRSLNTGTASARPITPTEQATYLWDKLRASAVMLAAGVPVLGTDRREITWPRITSDVAPDWYAEEEEIAAGDPGLGTLSAVPHKLAHRVEFSNEVLDDSEPDAADVVSSHLATMLALKLDYSMLYGNPTANADSIRGLRYVSGIQAISMGTNGAALTDYSVFIRAAGLLRAANVPGPYVAVLNPRTATELELLKEATGNNNQIERPEGVPPFFQTTQVPVDETKGTATNATSAFVFAPGQLLLVRRQSATIELDRSRLFHKDMSEMRGKARADLLAPNPVAVVRVDGIIPPA
jgi:HK97 family phage prohead protease